MPEGDGGDEDYFPTPLLVPPGQQSLPVGGGSFVVGAPRSTPPPELATIDEYLDCSFAGNRVVLFCPGADTLQVFVAAINAAIGTAVLKIKTGTDAADGAAIGVDVTSTGSTQTQASLAITGRPLAFVEVSTVQADLLVRVRMTAMKA